jgi:hypothetical protein
MVLQVLGRLSGPAPDVFLLEDRVLVASGGTRIQFEPAAADDSRLLRFDANTPLQPTGTAGDFLLDDARRQPSQFDATYLASMQAVPATHRAIYLLPAGELVTDDGSYELCGP